VSTALGNIYAITLFVEDPQRAKGFYQQVFHLPVIHEDANSAVIKFDNVLVNLLQLPAADTLIAPAAVGRRDAGARCVLTVAVDDVDAVCAELARHGVPLLNGPMDRPWGVRTASFVDPDGHIWEIAH
jgi:catechol 2,3-dioxygenase-like lactoylglutathione lyase family enzyme